MKKPHLFYLKKWLLIVITAVCTLSTGTIVILFCLGLFGIINLHPERMGADRQSELSKQVSFIFDFLCKHINKVFFCITV